MLRLRWVVLSAVCVIGCSDTAGPALIEGTTYRDVTATALQIPALSGNTMDVALADFDGDSDLDVLLAMEFESNILLVNDGRGVFSAAGVPDGRRDSEDIGVADFDGDGHLDALIVSEDDAINELYLGDGSGGFEAAGDRIPVTDISNAVVVADLTGDGWPDAIIGNNGQNRFLRNDGAGGFVDETELRLPLTSDVTQDVELGDVDGDGDLDLIVGNEDQNRLLINDGGGIFSDESDQRLVFTGDPEETREADFGDIDGDGDLDLLFSNVALFVGGAVPQNRLLVNDGDGVFTDQTADRLPADNDSSFEGDFIDLDGDGDLDIVTGNGLMGSNPFRAYRNLGAGTFEDATAELFPASAVGRGFDVEAGDLNGDGRIDLYLASRGAMDRLLMGEP